MNWLGKFGLWLARSTLSNPDKWFVDYLGGTESEAGVRVGPESAENDPSVSSAVAVLSQDMAKLPLLFYRRRPDGKGRDRAIDHPLYDLLANKPNAWQTSFSWRELMMRHFLLRGNAYSLIKRDGRMTPRSLIPLHPDWVKVLISKDSGEPYYEVRMYGQGEVKRYSYTDMLHIRDSSDDGYVGVSRVSRCKDLIGLSLASQKHASKIFANGARPSGIITHPGKVGEDARTRFENQYQEKFGGDNKYKIAVFPEGMKYETVGMTNTDAQFIDLMKFSRSQIAGRFRTPSHKIGDLEHATFTNIEHQGLEYVTDGLLPIARNIEQALNASLLRETERAEFYFEFLFDSLLRGDYLSRTQGHVLAIQNGFKTPNEAREQENLNHYEGGDTFYMPLNEWPTDEPRPEKTAAPADDPAPSKKMLKVITNA